ncbi:hypothetical protein ACFWR9_12080 [Streptomyces sp. NPDC058534]|uniref:hypothetical protein n=1 Tax=Streptomyces sp. NPDC058534 TaxID=3346541 RepID=UPI0036627F4D
MEDHVEKVLLDVLRMQAHDVKPTQDDDPESAEAKETLKQVQADKAEARRLRADDLFSLAEFAREIRRLEEKERKTREKVATIVAAPRRAGSAAARIVREWETYTVEMKRREMTRRIEAVVIKPAGKGGAQRGAFRADLIEIVWK